MLSIKFDGLLDKTPELEPVYFALQDFLQQHPRIRHIEPERVLRRYPGLSPWLLSAALAVLVDAGELKRYYTVESPDHALAQEWAETPSELPEIVHDSQDEPFDRDDGDIVTIFR